MGVLSGPRTPHSVVGEELTSHHIVKYENVLRVTQYDAVLDSVRVLAR